MKTNKSLFGILTITAALAVQVQAQTFLTNGLVAYYPFNGSANDASGNGYNITNSVIPLAVDRFGRASSAAVLSQAMSAPNLIYAGSNDSRTISEWVRVGAYPANTTSGWGPKPSANYVSFFNSTIGGNNLASDGEFWLDNGSGGLAFFQMPISTNWSQIVVVYSGAITNAQVYFNGQRVPFNRSIREGGDIFGFVYPSQQYAVLTSPSGPGNSGFSSNNFIDDIRIYNRALSTNEVQQLFALESAPIVNIQKAVYLTSNNLWAGSNYQVQASSDLINWTNQGSVFTATNSNWQSTNYWNVSDWNQLFFRLQLAP